MSVKITLDDTAIAELRENLEDAEAWQQKIHGTDYDSETRTYSHANWSVDGERYIGGFLEPPYRLSWARHFKDAVIDEFYRNHIQTDSTLASFTAEEQEQIFEYGLALVDYYAGLSFEVERYGSALDAAIARLKRSIASNRHTIDGWLAWGINGSGKEVIEDVQLRIDSSRAVLELLEAPQQTLAA